MKSKRKITSLLLVSLLMLSASCTKVTLSEPIVKTHWIKAEEPAPFDGLLMNTYTYYQIRMKIQECK